MTKKITLNSVFIFVSLVVIIVGTIVSLNTISVNAQSEIGQNKIEIKEIKDDCDNFKNLIIDTKDRLTIIETHYSHITTQLNRIEEKLKQ